MFVYGIRDGRPSRIQRIATDCLLSTVITLTATSCLKGMLPQWTADGTIFSHVFIDIHQRWIEAMRDSICPHPPLLLPNVGRYYLTVIFACFNFKSTSVSPMSPSSTFSTSLNYSNLLGMFYTSIDSLQGDNLGGGTIIVAPSSTCSVLHLTRACTGHPTGIGLSILPLLLRSSPCRLSTSPYLTVIQLLRGGDRSDNNLAY